MEASRELSNQYSQLWHLKLQGWPGMTQYTQGWSSGICISAVANSSLVVLKACSMRGKSKLCLVLKTSSNIQSWCSNNLREEPTAASWPNRRNSNRSMLIFIVTGKCRSRPSSKKLLLAKAETVCYIKPHLVEMQRTTGHGVPVDPSITQPLHIHTEEEMGRRIATARGPGTLLWDCIPRNDREATPMMLEQAA